MNAGSPSVTVRMTTSFCGTPFVPAYVTVPVVTSRSLRLEIVSISAGAIDGAGLLGRRGEDLHDIGRQGSEADRLDVGAGSLGGVQELLHAVVLARERVGGEGHVIGDVAGAPHDRGVEAVRADDLDVAQAGGLQLLEQHAGSGHDHRRVEHVGRRIELRQLVDLRREVLVGDAEREVAYDLTAGFGEGRGERRGGVREVGVVGRGERHRRGGATVGGELGSGRRLHRVTEAHQERAAGRVRHGEVGRRVGDDWHLAVDGLDERHAVVGEWRGDDGVNALVEQFLGHALGSGGILRQLLDHVLDRLPADAAGFVQQVDLDASGFGTGHVGEPAEVAEVRGVPDLQRRVEGAVTAGGRAAVARVPAVVVSLAAPVVAGALVAAAAEVPGASVPPDSPSSSSPPHAATASAAAIASPNPLPTRMLPPR